MAQDIDQLGGQPGTRSGNRRAAPFSITLVALTFAMNLVARGVPETFAVFLLPVQKGLGVSRADITLTYSVYMLAYGLSGPLVGQLIDRFGARIAYGLGLASLGLGYFLAGFSTELWHYMVTVGLLGGLGAASLGMIVASALLSRWFTSRIGSIISLPYAAIGAGMLVHAAADAGAAADPRLARHAHDPGRRRAARAAAGDAAAARAHDGGLAGVAHAAHGRGRRHRRGAGPSAARCAPAPSGVCSTPTSSRRWRPTACVPHSVAYLIERGFDPLVAAGAFGFAGMLSAFGIIGVGWLSDRFGRRQTATLTYLSTIVGIAALSLVTLFPSLLLVYAFVLFFGLMQGARGPIIVAMVAQLFRGGVGAVYGTLSVAQGIGAGSALGLGPALRADRQLHRLVHAGDLRASSGWRRSGSCAACARRGRIPARPPALGPALRRCY